jgi:AAA15 family ATPase/GTPase
MIEHIKIENFKGFKSAEIPLAPFTLISGANDVGKTTLLQAIFLMYDHNTPMVFQHLILFQNAVLRNIDTRSLWEHLFYNFNINDNINIEIKRDELSEKLVVSRTNKNNRKFTTEFSNNNTSSLNINNYSYPLMLAYENSNDESQYCYHTMDVKLQEGKYSVFLSESDENALSVSVFPVTALFRTGAADEQSVADLIGTAIRNKQIDAIIKSSQIIEPRIKNIVIGEKQMVYFDIDGITSMIPLSSMGAGIKDFIYMTALIVTGNVKILLIDEIGNGIYHSYMSDFINSINKLSVEHNCQIIATTHSIDCVDAFSTCAAEQGDRMGFVRLQRNKENIEAVKINGEQLRRMLDSDWEVR